ncbi:heme ABC transporter ATP-binding protein [Natronoarchaeum sp. GCM10025321]|uniref:heme ABC transporter ATP-binding protein n=2 Tax=unclassified Natronoarchaeum TaxID=2620183 RepID=UPI00361F1D8A
MTRGSIEVEEVSVSFEDVPVLSEVSARAESGQLVGLVGPNGSGKTTLLRTISGALTPDSGEVRVDGDDVHALSSKAASQRVAVVPQDTSISFSFDVRQIVGMGRTAHRGRFEATTEADHAAVEAALERTATEQFAERSIDAISGGERQRVLLARAIAQETPALLLDEPTASLDVNHQIETLQLVRSLVDDGTAAVAAIHDLDLAARYCDSLVLLSEGEVVATGSPESVLTESTISTTFDVRSVVGTEPVTGTASVRALEDRDPPRGRRVHVLGSGTDASRVIAALDGAGFDLSLGPVPAGDTAVSAARSLGSETVVTPPLSTPSAEELQTATERARTASAAVLVTGEHGVDPTVVRNVLEDAEPLVIVQAEPSEEPRSEELEDQDVRTTGPESVVDAVTAVLADADASEIAPSDPEYDDPSPDQTDANVPRSGEQ